MLSRESCLQLQKTRVTSILAGIINAVTPLMTLLVILVLFREEKPKSYQVMGLFIFVLPHKLQPEALAATQVCLAAVTLLPFFILNGVTRYEFRTGPVIAMLALGILGTGYAYIWNFKIMAAAGSVIASSVTYVTPVVAVIAGVIFLSEPVSWNEPLGGAIVLLGAAISQGRLRTNRA